ncbi:AAA family ATPase, partial [Helicobacter pylori]
MIKSIEIENYKNFKHLKMENFKLINFFTGQNDTGKTNLLEALYINTGLCDPAVQVNLPPEHAVNISEFRKIKLNADNLKTFFYQENTANPISIRTEFEHTTIPLIIQYPTQTSYSKDINLNGDDIHMTNLINKTITKPQLQFSYNPSLSPMTMTYEFERQNLGL